MIKLKKLLEKYWFELIFFTSAFIFSWWLMWHTFDHRNGFFYIATKAWSDFSANIPLIRSFSLGENFPPKDPLFAGEPNHYHFLFYLIVGVMEKIGILLSFALNLPSSLGFFALLLVVYFLAKALFQSRFIATLSVIFLLFNGSLSFGEFFKIHPLSWQTWQEIFTNVRFPSFGPYDGKIVSAFWNLNIYTNQRHLAAAFAIVLITCLLIVKPEIENKIISLKRAVFVGLLIAFLPFFHSVGFSMAIIILGVLFVLFSRQRRPLFTALMIGLLFGAPQLFLIQPGGVKNNFRFHPGYLIADKLSFANFISYWFMNFGLFFFLIPLGFIKNKRVVQKVFLAFLPLFIIGNLFQFSPEIAANHKFFNLFLIVGGIFAASFIWKIWQKNNWGKFFALLLIFFSIFSGIIDFFPVKNDSFIIMPDALKNPDIAWIEQNTSPHSVFLTSSYLYHPASLAGRQIFLGWPYFPWAGGLDSTKRSNEIKQFFFEKNKKNLCLFLANQQIDYVALDQPSQDFPFDPLFWQKNFNPLYQNKDTGFKIYEAKNICFNQAL